ncbi:MAG: N-6 DNA methylase, partial [Elusimicrobiota bacterium]
MTESDKKITKQKIQKLVEKYEAEKIAGKIPQYTEAETKTGFIEPLFQALGWDTQNRDEVGLETNISGGRVDYSFKLGGIVKFFVEAKPLKADLNNPEYSQQAINYSWHKGVVWAILTDFESIKVFNAEWKEDIEKAKAFDLQYTDYLNDFDTLWLLSKESILSGQLDKWSEKFGKKTKKQPVSKQILADLLAARTKLTKNILKYPRLNKISETELDEAVQRILDRLIFIRTCEDKGIEQKHLLSAVRDRRQVLNEELKKIFREFDDGYNSKLFDKHICDDLTIDDEVLKEVIESLYQTQDGNIHYDFGAINADVLGNIYEQYLGHILKKTSTTTKLKETHQHRKEQGIYYTPTYIVDYIVKNTVGEVLKTAKPKNVRKLRILDPACGSGSFLTAAYDELFNYWIGQNEKQSEFGTVQKTEILSNNIYGVDLDKQAVEITQVNLLLKNLYRRERLPMLKNIRCGNSLIDDPQIAGKKAFNWEEEFPFVRHSEAKPKNLAFKNVQSEESQNGFDVIIGNPPYVRPHKITINDKEFFWEKYKTFKAKSDIYSCFMERGIDLLKEGGLFSFIVPHTWTSLESFFEIRKYIMENCRIVKLVQLPQKVFQEATVETTIFVLQKEKNKSKSKRNNNKIIVESLNEIGNSIFVKKFSQKQILSNHLYNFELYTDVIANTLLNKIKSKGKLLETFIEFCYGLKTGDDEKFLSQESKNDNYRKLLRSKDIGRYSKSFKGEYVWYVPDQMIENKLTARPGNKQRFENEKIVVARMGKKVEATYDDEKYYIKDGMLLLKKSIELKYILGILNSKLINYFYGNYFITIDVLKNALLNLPIAETDNNTKKKLIAYVEKMLDLNKQLQKFGDKITDERKRMESEIQKTDKEIDNIVYKL